MRTLWPRQTLFCALLCCLSLAPVALVGGEDPIPRQPISPWYGEGSPFVFSEGDHGEKLVKVGNQEYWILTPDKLATDPNPGLMHRNVAMVGGLGKLDINTKERYWRLELANDKTVYTHGPNSYEENLDLVRGLVIGYDVILLGQAKTSPDGKGSILVVNKPLRIPPELDRYQSFFDYRRTTKPDYEVYKQLADELDLKAAFAKAHDNETLANQYRDLRGKVIEELLSLRAALLNADQLTTEEMFEYMGTILKYNPDDRDRAAVVLKKIMKKEPNNPKVIEPQKGLLPDWVLCSEAKEWMTRADCEKLRQARLAALEKLHQEQVREAQTKMAAMAMNSNQRHVVALKNQALLNANGNALPKAGSTEFKALADLLHTSDDYRLVQSLMLQAVAQLDTREWIRLIEPILTNENIPIRLLAFRLGGYSNDLPIVKRLALALRVDHSNMLKTDAVQALCETRSKTTVQALADCLVNSSDDALNALLLTELQKLTNRKDTEKEAWQKYAANPAQIVVVPE